MSRKFLAKVGNAKLLGRNTDGSLYHIADVRTLTESTLNFSSSTEEIRAGAGAKLYGRFNHTTGMAVTLTDAMFDMNYIGLQIGSRVLSGADLATNPVSGFKTETFNATQTSGGTVTLSTTPADIGVICGLDHKLVWVRESGCDASGEWTAVEVESTSVTLPAALTSKDICVEYMVNREDASKIIVSADFIPAEMILLLTTQLFSASANDGATGEPWGDITVKIPRFQLDGSFDLSMAMTSAATMSLSGTALAVDDGSCDGNGVYAEIVEVPRQVTTYAIVDIVVDPEYAKVGQPVVIWAKYENGAIKEVPNGDVTDLFDITVGADPGTEVVGGKTVYKTAGTASIALKADQTVGETITVVSA